ncbi:MAG: rod shape-determining protein [uncultured bacterium]|nr:MAG: rod shape-determining protein [uncultured bacterium]
MSQPYSYEARLKEKMKALRWQKIHLDPLLVLGLLLLSALGLLILYSASNANQALVNQQGVHLIISFILMILAAQISPKRYQKIAPWLYFFSLFFLIAVLLVGKIDHGGRRWLSFGLFRFQPSELMILALPMMLAWFFDERPLPPSNQSLFFALLFIFIPTALIAKEPDLGTAIVVALAGFFALLLAGIRWRFIGFFLGLLALASPLIWHFMHLYQKDRILTFLNPERDPLGKGYHIIQSKIAIGSGGFLGKGWMHGTQCHLSFLPAHTTDFIFAVSGEEFGLIGCVLLLLLFLGLFARCLWISVHAQNSFTRLLSGSLSFTFIISTLINLGMVVGLLPVVGVPLPLISYGGSVMMILMINFGIIQSIQTHRRLWAS